MSFNESLSKRIESVIKSKKARLNPDRMTRSDGDAAGEGFTRKEMFGGVGFMLNGNMCVGVYKDDLIVRFDHNVAAEVMKKKGAKPFDITGRPMKGWLLVGPEGTKGTQLIEWMDLAISFVKTLPKK